MCVPEGNNISMNPNEIKVLSPQKAVLETLEFHLIRINDFSGKRDISPKYLHKLHGASKKFLWFEGHRKVVLQAEFKQNREPIHYVEFPPILINGVEVDVPLMEFRLKAHFTSGAAFFPIYILF